MSKITLRINSISKILADRGLAQKGRVQQYIDSEVMRVMEPYMPFDTGMMARSMPLASVVGSGEVVVNTVYAHRRLLSARKNGLRGPQYFDRMKADRLDGILSGALKIAGGK